MRAFTIQRTNLVSKVKFFSGSTGCQKKVRVQGSIGKVIHSTSKKECYALQVTVQGGQILFFAIFFENILHYLSNDILSFGTVKFIFYVLR